MKKGDYSTNISEFDPMPTALRAHRTRIRDMMVKRCEDPETPIPKPLAIRAADWITFLTVIRADERRKLGGVPFPDEDTLREDIARSAESVETCVLVMREEVREAHQTAANHPLIAAPGGSGGGGISHLVPDAALPGRAALTVVGDDPQRGSPRGGRQAAGDSDGAPESSGPAAGGIGLPAGDPEGSVQRPVDRDETPQGE